MLKTFVIREGQQNENKKCTNTLYLFYQHTLILYKHKYYLKLDKTI